MMMLGSGDMPTVVVTVMATYLRSRPMREYAFDQKRWNGFDGCVRIGCFPACMRRCNAR